MYNIKDKISICLSTKRYGGLDMIMGSLANQTYKNFELIICDAIYDERHEEVMEFADKLDLDVYHVKQNRSIEDHGFIAEARNNCMAYGTGEYYYQIDDFFWLEPNVLETHIMVMNHHKKSGPLLTCGQMYSYHSYDIGDPKGKISTFKKLQMDRPPLTLIDKRYHHPINQIFTDYWREAIKKYEYIAVQVGTVNSWGFINSNFMVPYEECYKINGYDEDYIGHGFDETDFVARLAFNGVRLFIINNAVTHFMSHPDRIFASPPSQERFENKVNGMRAGLLNVFANNTWNLKEQHENIVRMRLLESKRSYKWKHKYTDKDVDKKKYRIDRLMTDKEIKEMQEGYAKKTEEIHKKLKKFRKGRKQKGSNNRKSVQ